MSGKIIIRGRTYLDTARARLPDPRKLLNTDGNGEFVDCSVAVGGVYRAGHAVLVDGVAYREVSRLDPLDGWASLQFWTARWQCSAKIVLQFVELGLLDAAQIAGTATRKFRCRDERLVVESPTWLAVLQRRGVTAMHRARRLSEIARFSSDVSPQVQEKTTERKKKKG